MPRKCSVFNCRTGYDGLSSEVTKIRVYGFPKDDQEKHAWARSLPNQLSKVTDTMGVCGLHWPTDTPMTRRGRYDVPMYPPSIFPDVPASCIPTYNVTTPRRTVKTTNAARFIDIDEMDKFIASDTLNKNSFAKMLNEKFTEHKVSTMEFIKILKDMPELWQKSHPDFTNRERRNELLAEVGQLAGSTPVDCAKKLKTLKDTMRLHVSKLPVTSYGAPDFSKTGIIRWTHFKHLMFMRNEFVAPGLIKREEEVEDESQSGGEQDEASDMVSYENYFSSFRESEEGFGQDQDESPRPPTYNVVQVPEQSVDEEQECDAATSDSNTYHSHHSVHPKRKRRRIINHHDSKHSDSNINFNSKSDTAESRKTMDMTEMDELAIFAADIANDLRKIKNPINLMRAKASVRRVAEEFVLQELELLSTPADAPGVADSKPLLTEVSPKSPQRKGR